jgi:hypothetical protein
MGRTTIRHYLFAVATNVMERDILCRFVACYNQIEFTDRHDVLFIYRMSNKTEVDMDRLAENLLVFDQLLAKTTSTGSIRLDVHDVIDERKLNASASKLPPEYDNVDALVAAVRLDGDQILSPDGTALTVDEALHKPGGKKGMLQQRAVTYVFITGCR